MGALRVCAVLHKRQGRGWASCPTRPAHAPDPWRPTVPARGWNPRPDGFLHPAVGKREKHAEQAPGGACSAFRAPFSAIGERNLALAAALPFAFALASASASAFALASAFCLLPFALASAFAVASASAIGRASILGSAFAFSSTPIRTGKLSGRGVGGLAGPLGAMDGAHEPPGMDLRRVPPTHPPRANPSQGNMALRLRLRLWLRLWLWLEIRLGEASGQAPTH